MIDQSNMVVVLREVERGPCAAQLWKKIDKIQIGGWIGVY